MAGNLRLWRPGHAHWLPLLLYALHTICPIRRSRLRRGAIGSGNRHAKFCKHLLRNPKAVHRRWYTGVDHDLQKHLTDLGRRGPIGECAANVSFQFVWPVEDTDHGEVEEAPLLAIESRTPPDLAPAI